MSLVNCILWNDLPQEVYFSIESSENLIIIAYTDIQGGLAGIVTNDNGEVFWEEGNINEDPFFVNAANGNYNLSANSPCIDAGDPDSPLDPDGTIADMGAFYYDQTNSSENYELNSYPNPFNSSTTISFETTNLHENTRIDIYNIKG